MSLRSRRANGRCLLAFLALALILAVSCREPARSPAAESGATTGSTSAPPATRRDVRLAYVSTATTFTPLWAAQEYGLLEQYGLHTDGLLYINGGPAIAQALVAGELDGAYSAFSPMVTAIMGGADLKVVAGFSYGFVHQLFTREGTGVRQPQDLVASGPASRASARSRTP